LHVQEQAIDRDFPWQIRRIHPHSERHELTSKKRKVEKKQARIVREEVIRVLLEIAVIPRQVSKCLVEIPLIQLADIPLLNPAATNITLDGWMAKAFASDKQLGIIRDRIPFAAVYIPSAPHSADFFNLAVAIGKTPIPQVAPENHNQACWIKTNQYYWQARGLVFAHRLFGLIPDPLAEGGVLNRYLPETSLHNLRLNIDYDLARYRLLLEGEPYIKTWAATNGISYPFKSPLELFLQTLKDGFQILLLLGPLNLYPEPLSKRSQRYNLNARIRLLSNKEWDDLDPLEGIPASPKRKKRVSPEKLRPPYKVAKQQYVRTLKKMGWNGYWLLALLKYKKQEPLKPLFEAYLAAFRAGSELFIPDFEWIDGQPYQAQHTSQRRAEAVIDADGYIRWYWA
jgi:hypothetical protein